MSWLKDIIGTEKAIIAMCHLQALPGDAGYDAKRGMKHVVDAAKHDLLALQDGGVDAVMFSNEFSLPYLTDVRKETLAAMGRVIGELKGFIRIPFGVNVLWDGKASLDLAIATDALFVREIFSGVYGSDFGLWNTNFGETVRHQKAIDAQHVKLLFNIYPEASAYLGERSIEDIAKTTVFNCKPDALCVSGLTAGAATDSTILKKAKNAVKETVVFANTGSRHETIESILSIADGAVVGTCFKRDGKFENEVDQNRVQSFMQIVKQYRLKNGY
ncbi:MAG: BtpA/SgcQ family protein [Erysipelotrichaceae bacterium]|jgi:membrane complex biogenesis BtpA family protein|nr:BtpA/SgcQ family protein [Erysipelotrichaceae bacterium]